MKKHKVGDSVITSIRDWTLGKSLQKGTPYVRINLEGFISWTGWLSPKAMPYTMKTLVKMGFKGSNLKDLVNKMALNTELEIHAVIDDIRVKDGKTYYSASFLNLPNEGGFSGDTSEGSMMDFDIDTRAYVLDTGKSQKTDPRDTQSPAHNQYANTSGFATDDIPF